MAEQKKPKAIVEVGRICKKIAGREAGRSCAVVKKIDETFVEIAGVKPEAKIKRRKCNLEHLEPTSNVIAIKAGASDADIKKAVAKAKLEI